VVVTKVLNKYTVHVTQSMYSQKAVLFEENGKNWTQNWKMFHICFVAHLTHSDSSVAVHLPHTVLLNLKQSLLILFWVQFAAIWHYVRFSALAFLGAVKVDIECGLVILALLLDLLGK